VLPPGADPPKCSIEGRVLSLAGEPLKKAALQLRPMQDGPANPNRPSTVYSATTGADGKFAIPDLPAATYVLAASRVGYIQQSYGAKSPNGPGTRLKLDAGQAMKDLVVQLTPQGMIYGKVVDEDGEPVPSTQISVQRWMYVNGARQLRPVGWGNSQADGSFVVGSLAPGRYVMSAISREYRWEITENADKNNRETNLTTFYPNAPDATSAAVLDVTPGAELRGIEIHIRRGRAYEVRGHIQNTTSLPNLQNVNLYLWPKGSPRFSGNDQNAYVQEKTTDFQFKDLAPGTYLIEAHASAATKDAAGEVVRTTALVGRLEVTIGDANLEGVTMPLGTGIEIAGSIRTEGNPPATDSHPSVNFMQTMSGGTYRSNSAEANLDGSFRTRGLVPESYRVEVAALPDGSYVKSTNFDGQDITGKDLDLTAGNGGELLFLVSPNAADVTGIVRNQNGDGQQRDGAAFR
jgi:hypothetical protein